MKILRIVAFWLLVALCFLNILVWPVNKYQWMLLDDPKMILPLDSNASFSAALAVFPIFFLLVFLGGAESRRMRLLIIMTVGFLLGTWAYKFHVLLL